MMLIKGIETMEQVPWLYYATYDEDGCMKGLRDDCPEEIRRLYEERQKEIQSYIDRGENIPK